MAENLISSPAYRVAFSMYVALGGDPNMTFDSVDAVYAAIDELYGKGTRVTIENLSVEITENGDYLYDNEEITGYKPVSVNVNVPQKYTDEQVESLKDTARQEGYDSGYDLGVADGFIQGESEGYNDGYAEGLEDGAADQKELLEAVTFTENGTYTKEDGYNQVTVAVEMPEIPTFETEELSIELTKNGTYNYTPTKDGYSKVDVTVNVGGVASKPKIYNGFKLLSTDSTISSTQRLTTKLKEVDFTQYDWSAVYDLTEFFGGFKKDSTNNAYAFVDSDFDNFRAGYNGQMTSCSYMFATAPGSSSNYTLKEIPDFSMFTDKLVDMQSAFVGTELASANNLAKWNTSNVMNMGNMFYNCSSLTSVPNFNTNSVINMSSMFYGCNNLKSVPEMNTENVVDMSSMFYNCRTLTTVPNYNTNSVITMATMFYNCSSLTTVPEFDMSNVTACGNMFYGCTNLLELSNLNTKSVKTWSNWLPPKLQKVGIIDCDSTTNVQNMLTASTDLTEMGGFRNLGMQSSVSNTNSNYFLYNVPNITYESLINIFNLLYDRASVGYTVLTLKLAASQMSKLSDDDKAIAINKGWSLSS